MTQSIIGQNRFAFCIIALLSVLIVAATLVPTDLEIDAETYFGRPDGDAARRDEGFGRGLFNETQTDGKFDVQAAARLWERHVGCASFRARHRHLINRFRDPLALPPNPSLQARPPSPRCRHAFPPLAAGTPSLPSLQARPPSPRCRHALPPLAADTPFISNTRLIPVAIPLLVNLHCIGLHKSTLAFTSQPWFS
ncbi:unnamed protein product [Closterium sp. Yama58-4]|nr:unnamed protein product [Closterium sp. Yama58-4]